MYKSKHTGEEIDRSIGAMQYVTNPNLLDNWYFANPVNQRGQTEYTTDGYTVDRWRKYNGATVTLTDEGVTVSGAKGSAYRNLFCQWIEAPEQLKSKQVTFSALVKNASGPVTLALHDGTTHGGNYVSGNGLITGTVTISDSASALYAFFCPKETSACSFGIEAVKLELGSVQTLAHQDSSGNWVLNEIPNYADELAKCQRYQISLSPMLSYSSIGNGIVESETLVTINVPLPCEMRAAPTLVYDGTYQIVQAGTTSVGPTVIAVDQISKNCVRLVCTVSGAVAGLPCYLRAKDSKGSKFLLDANL